MYLSTLSAGNILIFELRNWIIQSYAYHSRFNGVIQELKQVSNTVFWGWWPLMKMTCDDVPLVDLRVGFVAASKIYISES